MPHWNQLKAIIYLLSWHLRHQTNHSVLVLLSLCLFSPSLLSCLFDSAKFRAVTLSEGFWQRNTVVEDSTALQIPCCQNPGRTASRSLHMTCLVAEPVVLVRFVYSVLLLPGISHSCVTFSAESAASVQRCYFSVELENISEVHLIPLFFTVYSFYIEICSHLWNTAAHTWKFAKSRNYTTRLQHVLMKGRIFYGLQCIILHVWWQYK